MSKLPTRTLHWARWSILFTSIVSGFNVVGDGCIWSITPVDLLVEPDEKLDCQQSFCQRIIWAFCLYLIGQLRITEGDRDIKQQNRQRSESILICCRRQWLMSFLFWFWSVLIRICDVNNTIFLKLIKHTGLKLTLVKQNVYLYCLLSTPVVITCFYLETINKIVRSKMCPCKCSMWLGMTQNENKSNTEKT